MNASVHFLNVGWGDAHFIRLPSGALTLIDGGDGSLAEGRDHPLRWMERRGLRRLDAMIVTHLHEDHLNGLLDVVRSVEVALAILPYGLPERAVRFRPELEREASELTRRVCGILETYRELIRLLEARGTEIRWRSRHASAESSVVWEEHGFRLEHLYPWQDDPLPALEVLHSVFDADGRPEEERLAELAGFFDKSNDDSSVYRLTADGDETVGVLFGGDLMEGAGRVWREGADWRAGYGRRRITGWRTAFRLGCWSWCGRRHASSRSARSGRSRWQSAGTECFAAPGAGCA